MALSFQEWQMLPAEEKRRRVGELHAIDRAQMGMPSTNQIRPGLMLEGHSPTEAAPVQGLTREKWDKMTPEQKTSVLDSFKNSLGGRKPPKLEGAAPAAPDSGALILKALQEQFGSGESSPSEAVQVPTGNFVNMNRTGAAPKGQYDDQTQALLKEMQGKLGGGLNLTPANDAETYKKTVDALMKEYKDKKPQLTDNEIAMDLIRMSAEALQYDQFNPTSGLARLGKGATKALDAADKQKAAAQARMDKEMALRLGQAGTGAQLSAQDRSTNNAQELARRQELQKSYDMRLQAIDSGGKRASEAERNQIARDAATNQVEIAKMNNATRLSVIDEMRKARDPNAQMQAKLRMMTIQMEIGQKLKAADPTGQAFKEWQAIIKVKGDNAFKEVPPLEVLQAYGPQGLSLYRKWVERDISDAQLAKGLEAVIAAQAKR